MAEYTAREWSNGDIVTASNLNHIEEGIENASSGCGYECTEESTVLTDETVTTAYDSDEQANLGNIVYSQLINADKIRVTFNGVEYECNAHTYDGIGGKVYDYGNISDFSEYPFRISSAPNIEAITSAINVLRTSSAGTYTVKIEVLNESITTTPCFQKAVESVAKGGRLIKKVGVADCNHSYDKYDISLTEMQNLVLQGVPMMIETTKPGQSVYKQILNYIFSIDRIDNRAELVVVGDSDLALAKMTLYANNGANEYMDSGRCGLS